jgi:radical SAM superfamily enzyme YgiQ (UPF0313 family)
MRLLLINANLKDDILAAPPIGLSYVACAAEAAGHTISVLDLCFQKKPVVTLISKIGEFKPDIVGLSVRNIDNANLLYPRSYLPEAKKIMQTIRNTTSVPVVIGGSGASMCPAGILSELKADFIIVSDGEQSLVDLLAAIENRKTPKDIPGLGMIRNGIFSLTDPVLRDFRQGNAELGKWFDMKPYQRVGSSYIIQTKRGCPQKCIYCTYNQVLEGNRLRLRSPSDVVDEIEEASGRYQPECFEFVDSVFNAPLDHCVEIVEEILHRSLKVNLTAMGVSPRDLGGELLDLMWRAGFRSFMISPESASEDMIRNYRKGFTVDDLVISAEAIARTRFTVMWYFLIGGPGESNSTLNESLNFTLRYLNHAKPPPHIMATFFLGVRLYPGTEIWEMAMNEGLINSQSDPLEQLWYISRALDLERAVEHMNEAALKCPGIILGFDERYLAFGSKIATFMGKIAPMPKPYWRHIIGFNRILLKTGLRLLSSRKSIASEIQHKLEKQTSFEKSES